MSDIARLTASLADRYRIERELGAGGMATVYLAEDVKHGRRVAIKVLREDLSASLGKERFLREIKVAAGLQHPHVLPLYDSGDAHGLLYYVMPFVDGLSLREKLVKEGALPIAEAARILRDVADALTAAHKMGIVHRDLKPENVMLSGRHALVTDFGVAKALSEATGKQSLTTVGVALGTPTYMAPEQAVADPHVDHRADIYAFGVMAYELLAGQPPFTGMTPQQVLAAHVTAAAEPVTKHRATIPPVLAALVMKCLEKKPADRWQSADELLPQLEAVTSSGGMTPTDTRPVEAVAPLALALPLHRRRPLVAAAAAVIVVVLGLLAWRSGWFGGKPGEVHLPTLAVLPFENLGAADDEYFADGMTEELTGRLAKVQGLAVIARTSMMQYKKTTKPIPQIARELGADFLVEGTVRWEKNTDGTGRVRIAPQVVRARDGTHVWADSYDKPYGTGIFDIQSEIADRVTEALSVKLMAAEQKGAKGVPTKNLEAYDSFLRGMAALDRDLGQNWATERQALDLFQRAVQLDPAFAKAHEAVAVAQYVMTHSGYDVSLPTGVTKRQRLELARDAAERAISLDADLTRAHWVLGLYHLGASSDTSRYRQELSIALRGNHNDAQSIGDHGWMLIGLGQREEGLRELQRSLTLDPRNPGRLLEVARFHVGDKDYRSAEDYYNRAIAVAPGEPTPYVLKAWLNLTLGRMEEARADMREGIRGAGMNATLMTAARSSSHILIIRILHDDFGSAAKALNWKEFGLDTVDYYLAKALAYRDEPARARSYSDSLAATEAPRANRGNSDPLFPVILAWGRAGSGRKDAASREITRFLADTHLVWYTKARELAAEACVFAAEYNCAIDQIRAAMVRPLTLSPALLKLDPVWDPLRGRADFKKLVEQP